MPKFSGPSSCPQQWVQGDAREWIRIREAFVRFCLSNLLDSTPYFKGSWARCSFLVILDVFLLQNLIPSSFVPTKSWIHIILYQGTVQVSYLVWKKSHLLSFQYFFNGNFLNNMLTPTFFKFSLIFPVSNEKKVRGYDKTTPQQSRTVTKSYDDCSWTDIWYFHLLYWF